jgi:hypothetical protein
MTPDQILIEAAELFKSKNAEYGDAYMDHPILMHMLFGEITLRTVDDYAKFTRVSSIIAKLNRYAKNFPTGHADSARDLVVYAAMLDQLERNNDSN